MTLLAYGAIYHLGLHVSRDSRRRWRDSAAAADGRPLQRRRPPPARLGRGAP